MFDPKNIQNFLSGVDRFYNNFARRNIEQTIIWQEGSTSVLDYSLDSDPNLPILFFIPSLINKSYILDLSTDCSMVKHFAAAKHSVYLVDFSEPLEDEMNFGFADYQSRISRAMQEICRDKQIITIGYCLGGVFSCAVASERSHNIIKQILIAVPWNLSHLSSVFGLTNPVIASNFEAMIKQCNKISPTIIQWWFSSLSPSSIWNKFRNFANMQQETDVNKFMAIEQWVNDGISLSKAFALECLSMLVNNDLEQEKFFNLNIEIPSLTIVGREDKIVPNSSCLPLYNKMLNRTLMIEDTGHIGLVVGKIAKEKIWVEIERWVNL